MRGIMGCVVSAIDGPIGDTYYRMQPRRLGGHLDVWPIDRKPKRVQNKTGMGNYSQAAFTLADSSYTALPFSVRATWKAAIKAKNTTAYTLWMKESLSSLLKGGTLPAGPGESGGFTTKKLPPTAGKPRLDPKCMQPLALYTINPQPSTFTGGMVPRLCSVAQVSDATRWRKSDGTYLPWGLGGRGNGLWYSVEPTGYPSMAQELLAFCDGGAPTEREAAYLTNNRPVRIVLPADAPSLTFRKLCPAGYALDWPIYCGVFEGW